MTGRKMGTDVTFYFERKNSNDVWKSFLVSGSDDAETRNYGLFGYLADVRSEKYKEGIFKPNYCNNHCDCKEHRHVECIPTDVEVCCIEQFKTWFTLDEWKKVDLNHSSMSEEVIHLFTEKLPAVYREQVLKHEDAPFHTLAEDFSRCRIWMGFDNWFVLGE